ncbi:ADP-ribosylation factor-like protein [Patescibacteria group bacterium]|nr:ADP-ribosylation factor-like protein [Patescibacteria group bacterium]
MTASEITEAIGLEKIRDRPWHIQSCCALTGDGLVISNTSPFTLRPSPFILHPSPFTLHYIVVLTLLSLYEGLDWITQNIR